MVLVPMFDGFPWGFSKISEEPMIDIHRSTTYFFAAGTEKKGDVYEMEHPHLQEVEFHADHQATRAI